MSVGVGRLGQELTRAERPRNRVENRHVSMQQFINDLVVRRDRGHGLSGMHQGSHVRAISSVGRRSPGRPVRASGLPTG